MVETNIIILAFLIVLSAFFSGAEVALVSTNPIKVKALLKQRRRGSKALARLRKNPRRMIITILIGNNIVNVAAASIATVVATERFGSAGLGIAAGGVTLVLLIFGEITPKTFASTNATRIALAIARPLELLSYVLYPIIIVLEQIANGINRLIRLKKVDPITKSEIKSMLEFSVEEKIIGPEEKYIMERALVISDVTAYEIMMPFKNTFSLNANSRVKTTFDRVIKSGYSRIPIYKDNRKNITGVVFIKDVINAMHNRKYKIKLKDIATDPIFVPKHIAIDDLFKIFQGKQTHIAFVKHKNKIIGLVTLEDLIEELVGEITDESDVTPETIIRIDKNTIVAHGDTTLEKVNKFFNTALPAKNDVKLYELIRRHVKKPKKRMKIKIRNLSLILEDVREDKILKVKIIKKTQA